MKKKYLFPAIIILLLLSLVGCVNENKFIGSKDTNGFGCDLNIYESIAEIRDRSIAIVIAHYDSDPFAVYYSDVGLYASRYKLCVEQVFKGEITSGSEILFSQVGEFDSDQYETKIKKNKRYLLFLLRKSTTDEVIYDATGIEQGILEIQDDNKLYSYTNEGIMSTYDGKYLDEIIKDIGQ